MDRKIQSNSATRNQHHTTDKNAESPTEQLSDVVKESNLTFVDGRPVFVEDPDLDHVVGLGYD